MNVVHGFGSGIPNSLNAFQCVCSLMIKLLIAWLTLGKVKWTKWKATLRGYSRSIAVAYTTGQLVYDSTGAIIRLNTVAQ